MTEVKIPFKPMFKEAMLTGKKTWTSRTRQLANPGDTFQAFGTTFRIKGIYRMKLDVVTWLHHKEEGCSTPAEFIQVWKQIHPRKGYLPLQEVIVHEFQKEATP